MPPPPSEPAQPLCISYQNAYYDLIIGNNKKASDYNGFIDGKIVKIEGAFIFDVNMTFTNCIVQYI